MTRPADTTQPLLCPSTNPIGPDAKVFGIMTSGAEGLRVGYLTEALPATAELLAAATPAKPTEVFRAAAPCVELLQALGRRKLPTSRPHQRDARSWGE